MFPIKLLNLTIFDDSCPHIQQKVEVWMCWWTGKEVVVAYFTVQRLCNPKKEIQRQSWLMRTETLWECLESISSCYPKIFRNETVLPHSSWLGSELKFKSNTTNYHRPMRQNIIKNNFCSTGGMQDYNYIFHGCMELTLEISCCKYPFAKELPKLWDDNREVHKHLSSHHKFNIQLN